MRYASRAAVLFVAFVLIFGVAACGTNNGSGAGRRERIAGCRRQSARRLGRRRAARPRTSAAS